MNENIDQKIKNILDELRLAHQESEKHYATDVLGSSEKKKPHDIFDMALAFENEERLLMDLQLALSEKFPSRYSQKEIDFIRSERDRLAIRIRAWQNRQFPSKLRD